MIFPVPAISSSAFLFLCMCLFLYEHYGCHFGLVFWEGMEINAPIFGPLGLPENLYQSTFLKWRFDSHIIHVLQILQRLLMKFSMRWTWFSLPGKKLHDKMPCLPLKIYDQLPS